MNNKFSQNYSNNSNYKNVSLSNYKNINNLYRSSCKHSSDNKKVTFKSIKNNTISSLNDVEYFLNKIQNTLRYIKLYKLLK